MKKFFAKNKGFTLIELLVVIGILGILAAALVATIDPFEQLKKATDSKLKNIAVEFQTANVRYFTTHNAFPWNDSSSTNDACTDVADLFSDPTVGVSLSSMSDCLGNATSEYTLIGEGELKTSFTSNENDLANIVVFWSSADENNMKVCFAPTSKSQKASEAKWLATGLIDEAEGEAKTCPSGSAVDGVCWWCTE